MLRRRCRSRIRYSGSGRRAPDAHRHAATWCRSGRIFDREEFLPWLAERGIAYLAYSPMAAGILTGGLRADHVFSNDDWRSGRRDPDEEHPELSGQTFSIQ